MHTCFHYIFVNYKEKNKNLTLEKHDQWIEVNFISNRTHLHHLHFDVIPKNKISLLWCSYKKCVAELNHILQNSCPVLYRNVMNDKEKLRKSTSHFKIPKKKFNFFLPKHVLPSEFLNYTFLIIDSGSATVTQSHRSITE